MASLASIPDYAKLINASWHKTTESVLETARLCAEANNKLGTEGTKKLIQNLDFSLATFSKLLKIGQDNRLQAPKVKSLLPPNYTIVYQVAKLSPDDLTTAVKEGIITPKVSRADLDSWLAARKEKESAEPAESKLRVIATLRVPSDYDDKKQAKLEQILEKLKKEFGVDVERPRDPYAEAMERMFRQIDDHIRKGARRYIRDLKKQRLAAGGRHLTAAQRKTLWGFNEDETYISHDATWEEVQRAIDIVGSEDQFGRLRDEALRLHGVSESDVKEHPKVDYEEAMQELRESLHMLGAIKARTGARIDKPADLAKLK